MFKRYQKMCSDCNQSFQRQRVGSESPKQHPKPGSSCCGEPSSASTLASSATKTHADSPNLGGGWLGDELARIVSHVADAQDTTASPHLKSFSLRSRAVGKSKTKA